MAESPFALEIPESLEVSNNGEDFLKGFLEGIGEAHAFEQLKKCLKDMEQVFHKLKEALQHLKHMKLKEVIKGVKLLVSAVKEFVAMLKPCISGLKRLEKLIMEIAHINIMKIAFHIIRHPSRFIHAITDAIGGFAGHDYHKAGKGVGALLAVMFLGREEAGAINPIEFIKGLLIGIGEQGNMDPLIKCIKDAEHIFKKILEALEHIKKKKFNEVIKGITILISAVQELMQMLEPCSKGFNQLKKLINALKHPDIKKIAMRVLMHLSEIIADVMTAIGCFKSGDSKCAGKAVGEILKFIFIARSDELEANNALEFMKGFLAGIGESGNINNLEKCIKNMDSIFHKIISAINHIKKKKLGDIIKGITELISAIKQLMSVLKPCMAGFNTLKKLLSAITHPNIKKIALRILMHPSKFMHAVSEAISGFSGHNYNKAGHGIGTLLKLMFL